MRQTAKPRPCGACGHLRLGGGLRLAALAVFLLLTVPPASSVRGAAKETRLVLRNIYLRNCNNTDHNIKLTGHRVTFQRDGGHIVHADFSVEKQIRGFRLMEMKINKCREALSYNNCEYFTTWSWKTGICNLIVMKGMMWTPLAQSVSPALVCPLKEGSYHVANGTYDVNNPMFRKVFEGYLWTGTFTVKDQDEKTVACVDGAMQGIKTRA